MDTERKIEDVNLYETIINLITEIIKKYTISSEYLTADEIHLQKVNDILEIPIKGTCIVFSLIIASELYKLGIKSKIILTKGKNHHLHLFLKVGKYIVKPFGIKEYIDGKILFEKEYGGEDNIYEIFKDFKFLSLMMTIKDLVDKYLLSRSWNTKYNLQSRERRAKGLQRKLRMEQRI